MTLLQQGIARWSLPVVGSFRRSSAINAICFTAAGAAVDNVSTGANFVRLPPMCRYTRLLLVG